MTNPSSDSQEALMRRTYSLAGITDLAQTAFIECHGTGTPAGDPIEAVAVARVFGESGIYIGSIKPNLGHSEGASGLASLIKCVLALENRTIPPNIKFSKPNPKIPFESGGLVVPVEPVTWPKSCIERASINSFGFGGSNAHVIIDSASSVMFPEPPQEKCLDKRIANPHLLLYSANSLESLTQMTEIYNSYVHSNPEKTVDLAYTLANRRDHMPHRAFMIASSDGAATTSPPTKISSTTVNLVMAFTGQGAQWPQMGRDLLQWNATFRDSIRSMDRFLGNLADSAPQWRLEAELCKSPKSSRLYEAEIAQPTLTAIQIALVETLASFGIRPTAVVGHSGGEVAAAYAAGALTANEAIMVSLNRGFAIKSQTKKGAMAAIGMGWNDTLSYLLPNVNIACENSPSSVTISGDADQVKFVVENIRATQQNVLTKVLNVDKAYHSPHMVEVGESYLHLLEGLVLPRRLQKPFFSSVTGKLFNKGEMLDLKYWQRNLESPVLFNSAVTCLLGHPLGENAIFLEVGPHSALGGPLRQILAQNSSAAPYASLMLRQQNCVESFLSAIGRLWTMNVSMDLLALAPAGRCLPNLPPYPWHHPNGFWHESRAVREWRHRQYAYHDLLGIKLTESTEFEPVWRNILHLDNAPWLRDHVINDDIIFPFTGYIGLIGEAIRQAGGAEDGFRLRRVHVKTALVLHEGEPTELITTFRRQRLTTSLEGDWWEFTVTSHNGHTWTRHCNGEVATLSKIQELPGIRPTLPRKLASQKWYSAMSKLGLHFGPHFQSLNDIRTATTCEPMATARVLNNRQGNENNYHVHPTVIDSALQLLCCAETYGLSRKYRMMLPTVVESMNIHRCSRDVNVSVSAASTADGGIIGKAMCVVDDTVVVHMSGVCLSPLEDVNDPDTKDSHAAARHTWAPHIDFMDLQGLIKPTLDRSTFTPALNELTQLCLLHSQRSLAGLESSLPHMRMFSAWIDRQCTKSKLLSPISLDDASIDLRIDQIVGELGQTPAACAALAMRRICSSMVQIFTGEANAMEILREDDLLSKMYFLSEACDRSLFLKHLTHSKPNLRILEIGAGTGATSKTILAHLALPNGKPLYSRYAFTDISPAFLATAKETLKGIPNVDFLTLDISRDPAEQGFDHQNFDLIIATNVLHATPTLRETLANVRTLLADNGRLLLHELCSTSKWVDYVWGPFPGWWDGILDGRVDEPYVTPQRWNSELISVGFKPLDAVIFDAEEPFQMNAIMIASPERAYTPAKRLTLLCRSHDSDPRLLIEQLDSRGFAVSRFNLGDRLPVEQDVIAALDEAEPFFANVDETTLEQFKDMVGSLGDSRIMWLTRPCHMHCQDPRYAQAIGVARTIRSEMLLGFATCETTDIGSDSGLIADVFSKFQSQGTEDILGPDYEFAICNGAVHVGRFYPLSLSNALLTSDASNELILTLTRTGRLGTLQWSPKPASTLCGDDVEVVTHAVGLNFVVSQGLIHFIISDPNDI
jgi:acyl transferase domain-containing protein